MLSFIASVLIMIAVVGTLSGWMLRRDARDRLREGDRCPD